MGKIVGGNTNGGVQVDLRQFVGNGFMFQSFTTARGHPWFVHQRKSGIWLDKYDGTQAFLKDASFVVVRGLAGSGVSFRSVSNPKLYIRHRNFVLYASANDNSALFKKCATFNVRYGVGAGNGRFGISFESINFPGYFITVVGMRLKIVKMSTALKKAATWTPVTAQVKVTHTTQTVTQHTTQTVSCGFTCKYGHQKGHKIAHSKETTRPNCAKKCRMHRIRLRYGDEGLFVICNTLVEGCSYRW